MTPQTHNSISLIMRLGPLLLVSALFIFVIQLWLYSLTSTVETEFMQINPSRTKTSTTLLLMITTHAGDHAGRGVLRDTYLSHKDRFEWMFVMGKGNVTKAVHEENEKYNDIVYLDCPDDYLNLSQKIYRGFEAAVQLYDFDYLLKLDTDSYVNMPKFINYIIETGAGKTGFYAGAQGVFPMQWNHKDVITPSERKSYYMLGGGYVLSYDLVEYFADNWKLFITYEAEDLTIGVHLQHLDEWIFYTHATEMSCAHDYLVNHKVAKVQMYYLHYSSSIKGSMCAYKEDQKLREQIIDNILNYHPLVSDDK